jgi:uncharacterized repeat protein (TIGR01451 family)
LLAATPPNETTVTPVAQVQPPSDPNADPTWVQGTDPLDEGDDPAEEIQKRDDAYITARTAGDVPLSVQAAGRARALAKKAAKSLGKTAAPISPVTFNSPWTEISPNPIVQQNRGDSTFYAVSGRVSALAIRPSNGQKILGAAQGGIWTYDETSGTWTARTDDQPTLSIGAIAIAASNDAIVYAGTGEGNLSGDSYRGDGFLKSTDGGIHWAPIGGDTFDGASIAKIAVDPTNANRLWAAVIRGRAGSRRQTPPTTTQYGIWESDNGGTTWTLRKAASDELHGATDLVEDPLEPNVLYASFWGDGIYESTNGGATWHTFMNGFPNGATFGTGGGTRFALGIGHVAGHSRVLYAGFEWTDSEGNDQPSQVWKSVAGGVWQLLPSGDPTSDDNVSGYCGTQCFYDNLIGVDPTNSDIVYVLGLFNYDNGSGGIFRSMDGGQTWKDLGWDLHPDYHAIAIDPADTSQVMIGNDGGVWFSPDMGGRLAADDPIPSVDWQDLNGTVTNVYNDAGQLVTFTVDHRTNLQITQFTSIANVPTLPARVWGGTQDNGTLRKSTASASWFDVESGDGGQVLVDPTDANYVYGNYFGISPYRNTDGGNFFTNAFIRNGINPLDRSEFYVPEVMNQGNPNQLFLGTFRLYRTDNAKAANATDVHWDAISPDLTSGCTGGAPNGARGCVVSAIGVSGGGDGVYVGTLEGWGWFSPDAVSSPSPTWIRVGQKEFPNRPVADIAVDRSNDRIAYAAFNGFNAATPKAPGHVFRTTDAGNSWQDISSNLPDAPVNSIQLDASFPDTIYAGTDVGPFVTYNGGKSWQKLGTGFPSVEIWQLNLDPTNRNLAAGTHGRGAWTMHDIQSVPALVVSKVDAGVPVGAGSQVDYTITVRNIGNAAATGVTIADPIPTNTTFVSAGDGGALTGNPAHRQVSWSGLSITAGGNAVVHFSVTINTKLNKKTSTIVNDGLTVTSAQNVGATGSPHVTPLAPPFAVSISPASQTDGGQVGTSVTFPAHVNNIGIQADTYALSATSGAFTATVLDSTCTTPVSSVAVAGGASADICVSVAIPGGASNGTTDNTTVTATSAGDTSVSGSATVTTIAVAANVDTLLVDNDGNGPDVQSYYATALTSAGRTFDTWDLAANPVLPLNYMKAHPNIVWFTGNSYPNPIGVYETNLAAYLDGGGHLFMSGQDILDQSAGTAPFVSTYLHVNWDGSEAQNDKATASVAGEAGNAVTNGIGSVALDISVLLGAEFSDELTLIDPATVAFRDDSGNPDGLTVAAPASPAGGIYKVMFLAFPFEEYGSATDKSDLMTRLYNWFAAP